MSNNNPFNASLLFLLSKISRNDKSPVFVGKCKKCDSFTVCSKKYIPYLEPLFQPRDYYCYICGSVVEVMLDIPPNDNPNVNENSTPNIDENTKQKREFNIKDIHESQMIKIREGVCKYYLYEWEKINVLGNFGAFFGIYVYSQTKYNEEIYISTKEYIELILDYLDICDVYIDDMVIFQKITKLLQKYVYNEDKNFNNHCSNVSEKFIKNKFPIQNNSPSKIISSCFNHAFSEEDLNETMKNNNAIILKVTFAAKKSIITKFIF